jgi:hypothetical protein
MRFRKLRIAWSVACSIACLLLIAFWVRSYHRVDSVNGYLWGSLHYDVSSISGCFIAEVWGNAPLLLPQYDTYPNSEADFSGPLFVVVGRSEQPGGDGYVVISPYWCALLAGVMLGISPWLPNRFGLRTLLIVMTLIALTTGLIVVLNKKPLTPPLDVGDFPQRVN